MLDIFSGLLTELSISDLWNLVTEGIKNNADPKSDDVFIEKEKSDFEFREVRLNFT